MRLDTIGWRVGQAGAGPQELAFPLYPSASALQALGPHHLHQAGPRGPWVGSGGHLKFQLLQSRTPRGRALGGGLGQCVKASRCYQEGRRWVTVRRGCSWPVSSCPLSGPAGHVCAHLPLLRRADHHLPGLASSIQSPPGLCMGRRGYCQKKRFLHFRPWGRPREPPPMPGACPGEASTHRTLLFGGWGAI